MAETTGGPGQARSPAYFQWASVAPQWAARAEEIDTRATPITERMLAATDVRPGQRVLELACGPGGAGLAAAERVGPAGEVVVSDVAEEMVAIATERAAARGLSNVQGRVIDLEEIAEPDGSYDVVLCRDGLMFAADHARAVAGIARVLRPGGRVAIAAWGPREANPWLGLALDGVSGVLGIEVPPPGVPGPFSLSDADRFRGLLVDAGLADATVDEVTVVMNTPSFEAWWGRTQAVAGPLAQLLAGLPDETRQAIEDRIRAATAPYAQADGSLVLPGLNLVASARRP